VLHSHGLHPEEEGPLRGLNGSGTIFFGWCNLRCESRQDWDISQRRLGRKVDSEELAGLMLELRAQGCHYINFVTPRHVVAQIIAAVAIAANQRLVLPLVYNTGGYYSLEAVELLDRLVTSAKYAMALA
jgi:putative pyruvate formate lyase activating enzyme